MVQTVTPEQLRDLRGRVLEEKEWTREELRAAIQALTQDRMEEMQKAVTKTPAKKRAAAKPINLDDLI